MKYKKKTPFKASTPISSILKDLKKEENVRDQTKQMNKNEGKRKKVEQKKK